MSTPDIISDIALRCNDSDFKDFHKGIYKKALLQSQKTVAKRYELIQRLYNANSKQYGENYTNDMILAIQSFIAEYLVVINGYEYIKVKKVTSDAYEYVLYRDENKIRFNYSPRTNDDTIEISYTSDINIDDFEIEELEPIIPSQYYEEVLSFALMEIAKLGIVKFGDSEVGKKYSNIIRLYGISKKNLEKNLIKNNTWVQIKIYHPYED